MHMSLKSATETVWSNNIIAHLNCAENFDIICFHTGDERAHS